MGYKAVREHIAFGPTESFQQPVGIGFVRQRANFLAGATLVSPPIRIDHKAPLGGLAASVIMVNDVGAASYTLGYRELLSSDGIDGSNAEYKNAIWGPLVSIVAGATALTAIYNIEAVTPLMPSTQAIQLQITNGAGDAFAEAPDPTVPGSLGHGLHVRVLEQS